MTLEHLVISRPLAERLQGLGVKKESVFYWQPVHKKEGAIDYLLYRADQIEDRPDLEDTMLPSSAYTSGELGEMLPQFITEKGFNEKQNEPWEHTYSLFTYKERGTTFLKYVRATEDGSASKYDLACCLADTAGPEVEARGEMLAYLLERKLITLSSEEQK